MGLGKCAEKPKEGTLKPRLDGLTGSKKKAGESAGKGVNQSGTDMLPSGTSEVPERKLPAVGKEWQEKKLVR